MREGIVVDESRVWLGRDQVWGGSIQMDVLHRPVQDANEATQDAKGD